MTVHIKCFGKLQDLIGDQVAEGNFTSVNELMEALKMKDATAKRQVYCVAINNQIVKPDAPVCHGDTVCLMPPFAGG